MLSQFLRHLNFPSTPPLDDDFLDARVTFHISLEIIKAQVKLYVSIFEHLHSRLTESSAASILPPTPYNHTHPQEYKEYSSLPAAELKELSSHREVHVAQPSTVPDLSNSILLESSNDKPHATASITHLPSPSESSRVQNGIFWNISTEAADFVRLFERQVFV